MPFKNRRLKAILPNRFNRLFVERQRSLFQLRRNTVRNRLGNLDVAWLSIDTDDERNEDDAGDFVLSRFLGKFGLRREHNFGRCDAIPHRVNARSIRRTGC